KGRSLGRVWECRGASVSGKSGSRQATAAEVALWAMPSRATPRQPLFPLTLRAGTEPVVAGVLAEGQCLRAQFPRLRLGRHRLRSQRWLLGIPRHTLSKGLDTGAT